MTQECQDIVYERFFENAGTDDSPRWKFVPAKLGAWLLNETPFKTLKNSGRMYRYKEGVYVPDGNEYIKARCVELLGECYSRQRVAEALSFIESSTFVDVEDIDTEYFNLENGLLEPLTGTLKAHTPDVFSTIRIPISYDPDARCDLFLRKLSEKVDERAVNVLQEFFGYCFLHGQKYQKALLLHGPRKTMKSTILTILVQLLGQKNITGFPLQYLNENEFAPAYMFGKAANICADLTAKSLKDTGRFMTITGGDLISVGRKHEHPIDFVPSAKLVFSCNQIPGTSNKDLAFYRRWIILPFEKVTKNEDVDENLPEKLKKEYAGILNWAIAGLKRLEEQGAFSYWLDEEGVRDIYERNSDTVASFVFNNINIEDDYGVLVKRDVYREYVNYCKKNRLVPVNQIKFGRDFKNNTGCGNTTVEKIPAYKGVSLIGVTTQQKL